MTMKNFTRLLATILTLAMMFSMVACNFSGQFSGSLKLESFIIDPNSYKAEYVVGETVDFTGIKAIVKYNDETLNKTYTAADLTIAYDADITAEVGEKEVVISFQDANLGVKQETKITIKVVEADPEVTTPEATTPEQRRNCKNFRNRSRRYFTHSSSCALYGWRCLWSKVQL